VALPSVAQCRAKGLATPLNPSIGGTNPDARRSVARLIVAPLAVFLVACGYIRSGTWEDEPRNWTRAFDSEKPATVTVLHSRYWRSPHWSYEFQYFFQLRGDPEFKREFFNRNNLEQLPASSVSEAMHDPFQHAPAWFCPKAPEHYDAWVYRDPPAGNFKVLIDRETGDLFLTDYQV
jgi:hypothetical protein